MALQTLFYVSGCACFTALTITCLAIMAQEIGHSWRRRK